jgi:LysM repeat protein
MNLLLPSRVRAALLWALFASALLLLAGCAGDDGSDANEATATPTPQPDTYTVVAGDTLANIAAQFGVSVAELVVENEIPDPDLIEVGQVLVLPSDELIVAAGPPPPPLTCAEHRSLVEDALAAARSIEAASSQGAGTRYAPFLEEIDRVSGLLVRRSEASTAELDALLRVLARLAIDTTRLGLGQISAAEADIGATAEELRAAGDAAIASVCTG